MNGRKYAWKILHAEIRRRCGADEGLDFHPQLEVIGTLLGNARTERISEVDIIIELAGFGASFAQMYGDVTGGDLLAMAKHMETKILAEPDDEDEE